MEELRNESLALSAKVYDRLSVCSKRRRVLAGRCADWNMPTTEISTLAQFASGQVLLGLQIEHQDEIHLALSVGPNQSYNTRM